MGEGECAIGRVSVIGGDFSTLTIKRTRLRVFIFELPSQGDISLFSELQVFTHFQSTGRLRVFIFKLPFEGDVSLFSEWQVLRGKRLGGNCE